jgi:hypothetical protein
MMKGTNLDPFVAVTTWSGGFLAVNQSTFTLMGRDRGASDVTDHCEGELALFRWKKGLINLDTQANHDKLVALDGFPVDHGTAAATLFGTAAEVSLQGDADAWNAPLGLQLGSALKNFITVPLTVTLAHAGSGDPPEEPDPPPPASPTVVGPILRLGGFV